MNGYRPAPVSCDIRASPSVAASREPGVVQPKGAGVVLAMAGAVAFSAKGIVVKLAYGHGVDDTTLVAYRMAFALPLFIALSWWSSWGKPALPMRDWGSVFLLGLFGGFLTCALDFAGLQYVTAGLERLIIYLTPTIVLLFDVIVLKRPFDRRHVAALAVSYAGVVLVFGHEAVAQGSNVSLGAALVFGSAVTYAIYLSHSGVVVSRIGAFRLTGLATSVACFLSFAYFAIAKPASALVVGPEVLWLSLINGTLCTFVPIVMVMMAIERVGAPMAAQCGMAGPVATVAMGAMVLGEPVTEWVLGGSALAIVGIWMLMNAKVSRTPDTELDAEQRA
jgi:drug/metabolite transporter (DMT)-like permease